MASCVFCMKPETEIVAENDLALAFYDKYPVNEGHVLVIPRRHVESFFEANLKELAAVHVLLFQVKDKLETRLSPDGYNIGVNVGRAAGQTIFHLHVHIIPRYKDDVPDPRGGVRKIKPSLVPYLAEGE